MDFREQIAKALSKAIVSLKEQEIAAIIELPPESGLGDYSLPCFKLAASMEKKPAEIAKELAGKIGKPDFVEKVEVKGAYLNFFISKAVLAESTVKEILKKKEKYSDDDSGKGKKIMVEYSAPNTNKPLHIGHARNESLGMAISNLLESQGSKVIKANLLSDRGVHVCKSMLAYEKFGREETPEKTGMKGDYFVGEYYVLFQKKVGENPKLEDEAKELLGRWESGDKETRELWKKMDSWVISGFKETYKRFGSRFDVWFRESDMYDKAKPVIDEGLKKGVFGKDDEGAIVADLEKQGLNKKIIVRSDGTSVYITNDLALTKYKFEHFKLDDSIWVIGSEQNFYLRQLFKIFELLGYKWAGHCKHVSYGMVFLPEGRLKSREGRVVETDKLIDDIKEAAKKEITKREPKLKGKELNERAEKIALAAVKFSMLKVDANKDILFDAGQALNFEGETGPYLQYTYARAKSILRKAKEKPGDKKLGCLQDESEKELITALYQFPDAVGDSVGNLSPHVLCQHLLKISASFNSFYHKLPVIKAEAELRKARLALVEATAIVLKKGLNLLGIGELERM